MSVWRQLSGVFVILPIVGLILLGLTITLRSGVESLGRGQGRRLLLVNLTHALMLLAGCGAGLLAVQRLIGAPAVGW